MITALRSVLLLLVLTGLSWSLPERVPDHQHGFPEYDYGNGTDYEYETGGNYEDDIDVDYSDPPSFESPPETFTVNEGDAVTMPCTPKKNEHLSEKSHYTLIIKKTAGTKGKSSKTLFLGTSKVVKDSRIKLNGGQLEISRLQRHDAGEYVCYFENPKVVEVRHTLVVQYAPRTTKPLESTKTVGVKDRHVFHCEADGNPAPTITWMRAGGLEMPPGAVINVVNDTDTRTQSSLALVVPDRHAEGTYICSAKNGIGQPSSVNMTLRVTYKPEIIVNQKMVYSRLGAQVRLDCIVHAIPKPKVMWTHNNKPLRTEKPHEGSQIFSLNIDSLNDNDLGDYACTAKNNVGKTQEIITITDEPSAPQFTSAPNGGEDTSYVLTWDAWSYYNITNIKYTLKCREQHQDATEPSSAETWKDMPNYNATKADIDIKDDMASFKITLSQLQPATDYECYVKIWNGHKWGPGDHYVFSTRKNPVASQTTSDGIRISSFGISTALSLLLILTV